MYHPGVEWGFFFFFTRFDGLSKEHVMFYTHDEHRRHPFSSGGPSIIFGVFFYYLLFLFSYNKHSATVFIVHGHSFLAYCKKDGGEKPPVILRKIAYAHGVMGPLSFKYFYCFVLLW